MVSMQHYKDTIASYLRDVVRKHQTLLTWLGESHCVRNRLIRIQSTYTCFYRLSQGSITHTTCYGCAQKWLIGQIRLRWCLFLFGKKEQVNQSLNKLYIRLTFIKTMYLLETSMTQMQNLMQIVQTHW